MPGPVRASITRFAALCALVLGILAMHHVPTGSPSALGPAGAATGQHGTEHTTAGHASPTGDAPAPDHQHHPAGLHMCLAILLAATLALAVALLLRTARSERLRVRRASGPARRAGRAPPFVPSTSVFLSSLCILRV